MRENLEAVSRQAQLEKHSAEAEALQTQLSKVPLVIYVG